MNPVTNKIYVANQGTNDVTVIDGASNATTTVAAGGAPFTLAVNSVANEIYVANLGSNTVTVISGATNATLTLAAGNVPVAVGVNAVTNKAYVANVFSDDITVIDGASHSTITVPTVYGAPWAIALNPIVNQIYVTIVDRGLVELDGATDTTTVVRTGTEPVCCGAKSGDEQSLCSQPQEQHRDRGRREGRADEHSARF